MAAGTPRRGGALFGARAGKSPLGADLSGTGDPSARFMIFFLSWYSAEFFPWPRRWKAPKMASEGRILMFAPCLWAGGILY